MYTTSRRRKSKIPLVIGILIVLGIGLFVVKSFQKTDTPKQIKREERNIFSILLMGYGGGTHDGTYLTDSMMVVRIDTKAKTATLISLPRDIWVKVPTKSGELFGSKINAIYQMGLFPKTFPDVKQNGPGFVKQIVGNVLGIPIDYYVTVDFDGFVQAIDTIGSITVNVPKAFDDYEYPIEGKEKDLCGKEEKDIPELDALAASESAFLAYPCRYEHLHFDAGETTMDGATALKFVRSRHALTDGGDFGRAARQQLFVEAVKEKVLQINFIPKIVPLISELQDNITTDIPASEIKNLFKEFPNASQYTKRTLVLSNDNVLVNDTGPQGAYILATKDGISKWKPVHIVVSNAIHGRPLDSTASATTR